MKTLVLVLALVLNHNISSSLPTDKCDKNLEISTVLQQRCPFLASSNIFKQQLDIVEGCPKWCQLKEIQNLRKENEKDVLCLLFVNSLISFCTKNATLQNVDLSPPSQITVANVCTKLLLPNQTTEFNISAIIPSKKACEIVCSNYYENSPVVKECALAYYFTNLNGNSVTIGSPNSKQHLPEVDDKQSVKKLLHKQSITADTQKKIAVKPSAPINIDQNSANANQQTKQLQQEPEQKKVSEHVPSGETIKPVAVGGSPHMILKANQGLQDDLALPADVPNVPRQDTAPADHQEYSIDEAVHVDQSSPSGAQKTVKTEPFAANPEIPSIKHKAEPGKDQKSAENIQDHPTPPVHESVAVEANFPDLGGKENTEPKIEGEEEEAIVPKEEEMSPNESHNPQGYSRDDEENTYDEEIGTAEAKSAKKKLITPDEPASYNNLEEMDGESYFFSYFMVVCVLFVLGYVVYHNRQKVLALVLEGKRSKRQYRGRRPNSANYHKLDTNLEEAISSSCNKNSSHVIY